MTEVRFQAVREDRPGPKWQALWERYWPAYRKWCFAPDAGERPPRVIGEQRLKQAMPALAPTYRALVDLAGGGNEAARFLSLYRPAPYLRACSQAVWTQDEPALVRNYDYSPGLWEGVLWCSHWNEHRVLAMSDCLWGVLDGINDAGLVVSLAFGGREAVGDGFGCPLLLRYALEFCETARETVEVLRRVPTHMTYNVTVLDRSGEFFTAYLAPDRRPVVRRWPLATNHQAGGHSQRYVEATSSFERERALAGRLGDPTETLPGLVDSFLEPPLHNRRYGDAIGTLYTAVYYPRSGRVELRWPETTLVSTLDAFKETELTITFD